MKLLKSLGIAAVLGSLASVASAQSPVSINDFNLRQSGVSAVVCTLTSAGTCGPFPQQAGRTFHVQLSGTATAACVLERQLDGSTWVPVTVTAGGSTTTMYNWSYSNSPLSEDVDEAQALVPYQVDCGSALGSFTSGSLNVRISQ